MNTIRIENLWRSYWKVLVVGIAAFLLAYAISYLFSTTYEAQTQLLVRSTAQSILSGSNETTGPVVNGTDLSKALSDTQSALLSTSTVAQDVVDQLDLYQHPPSSGGLVHKVKHLFTDLKELVEYGHLVHVPVHQAIVSQVYNSLSSEEVTDSYVLQLDATAGNPKLAAAIANAAADALVQVANEEFHSEATDYAEQLDSQLKAAASADQTAAQALDAYESAHNVSLAVLQSGTASDQQSQLSSIVSEISNDQAKLQAAQSALSTIPETISTTQNITTGRSTTQITSQTPNPSYSSLQGTIFSLETDIAGLKEQETSLQVSLDPGPTEDEDPPASPTSTEYAQLQQLDTASKTAAAAYSSLSTQYQQALVTAAATPVELVRLDTALPPNFPVSPDRALYGGIGLLFGLALGFVLSHRGRRSLTAIFTDLGSAKSVEGDPLPTSPVPPLPGLPTPDAADGPQGS